MFRHGSITNGIAAIKNLGKENGFDVDATEDGGQFTAANLARYKAVVFLSTSGDILNAEEQEAFRAYLVGGGGLAGIHAAIAGAVATEGDWKWYEDVCKTAFTNHSAVVRASVRVEDPKNISTRHLPSSWIRNDEWYNYTMNPRQNTHVLLLLDESTYKGGTMGVDHPIAWCHPVGKGRFWYTGLGHTEGSFSEPEFLSHILGGIRFASGMEENPSNVR